MPSTAISQGRDMPLEPKNNTGPLAFKSISLLNLDISLFNIDSPLLTQVILQTPELVNSNLSCHFINPPGKVEVQVMAPKLLKISVPKSDVLLKLDGLPENIVHAKWSKSHHHLISLHVANKSSLSNDTEIFKKIVKFSTLKSLELSEIHAHPLSFWSLLMNLPLLETLIFSNCCFSRGREGSSGSQFQYPQTCQKTKLTEVWVSRETDCDIDSETEMLRLLLQNTPDLQMFYLVLQKKTCDKKEGYASLLGKMLSQDFWLNVNEQPEQVKFTLLKRSTFTNAHSSQKINKLIEL